MALYIRQFKGRGYISYFSMLLVSIAIYSIFYAMEISSTSIETSLLFYKLQYVGISVLPVFLFLFSVTYTRGKQWLTPARSALIFTVPAITLLMVVTIEMHNLFHKVTYINDIGTFSGLNFEPGIYYWFNQLYSFILVLSSIALFFKMWLQNRSFFGIHLMILIVCTLIPFLVYLLYLGGYFPKGFDPIPFAFILSSILIYIGMFRYRLFGITPLARSSLFGNLPSGLIVLDRKDRIIDINRSAEQDLGISESYVGKPFSEIFDSWPELSRLEINGSVSLKRELRRSDPDRISWFAANVLPLYDEHEEVHGRMIILEDITDRKLTEEVLSIQHDLSTEVGKCSDLESTLGVLMEHLLKFDVIDSGGIYLINNAGDLNLIKHKGLSSKFIAECSYYDHDSFHAGLVREGKSIYRYHSDTLAENIRSEGIRSLTAIPIHFEGTPIACMNLSSHTFDEIPAQTMSGLESIASFAGEYITRARMQTIMSRQKTDLENLFNSMEDLFFVVDESGSILSTNKAARSMLGYSEEELNSMRVTDIHPVEHKEKVISVLGELLCGYVDSCSIPLVRKDGGQMPVETRFTIGEWNGKKVMFGISRDMTEREIYEKEILEAKNRAEEASRIKSEFLANMSHELRTPLNSIIGFSQLLSSNPFGNMTEKETRYSENIMTSGQHLLDLINDILDISKVESGKMQLEYEKFSSANFFSEIEIMVKHLADKKNIEIHDQACSENFEMYADRLRMKQIMYNLLSNSLKFTPENGWI
ncbi:histidine kinase N-terminal 7TM domain-containing protein [Methanococcoides sp. FTZ1]|uniref:histidine kinase N-terminal 7TM domain-containing protein n=1 Tax=Methanococcoides sp. FTZ1 TaxID=3439061 RepID=UPI003F8483CB